MDQKTCDHSSRTVNMTPDWYKKEYQSNRLVIGKVIGNVFSDILKNTLAKKDRDLLKVTIANMELHLLYSSENIDEYMKYMDKDLVLEKLYNLLLLSMQKRIPEWTKENVNETKKNRNKMIKKLHLLLKAKKMNVPSQFVEGLLLCNSNSLEEYNDSKYFKQKLSGIVLGLSLQKVIPELLVDYINNLLKQRKNSNIDMLANISTFLLNEKQVVENSFLEGQNIIEKQIVSEMTEHSQQEEEEEEEDELEECRNELSKTKRILEKHRVMVKELKNQIIEMKREKEVSDVSKVVNKLGTRKNGTRKRNREERIEIVNECESIQDKTIQNLHTKKTMKIVDGRLKECKISKDYISVKRAKLLLDTRNWKIL